MRFLRGPTAAAGLAVINLVGDLGGFLAQTLVPGVHDAAGDDLALMLFPFACFAVSGLGGQAGNA